MSSEYGSNKPNFTQELRMLCTGLEYLNSYFQNLKMGVMMPHENSEDHYIDRRLMTPAENAKQNFDAMAKSSAQQLEKVNCAMETNVSEQKTLFDGIKCFEIVEAKISTAIEGKTKVVANAQKQVDQKERELSGAKEALGTAESKLKKARDTRNTSKKVAAGVFFLAPIIASPLILVSLAKVQEAVEKAKEHTHMAEKEVSASRKALQEALSSVNEIKKELDLLHSEKSSKEQELNNLKESMEQLKGDQARIIEVNGNIQNFYTNFCLFHGTFKVLWSETRGGYSLSILQDATNPVVESLRSLLQCSSVKALCVGSILTNLNFHLKQIEQVT